MEKTPEEHVLHLEEQSGRGRQGVCGEGEPHSCQVLHADEPVSLARGPLVGYGMESSEAEGSAGVPFWLGQSLDA